MLILSCSDFRQPCLGPTGLLSLLSGTCLSCWGKSCLGAHSWQKLRVPMLCNQSAFPGPSPQGNVFGGAGGIGVS